MRKKIFGLILVLAVIVFCGSAGYLAYHVYQDRKQAGKREELEEEVKIDIDDLLALEFNGERDGLTSPVPKDVFTEDTDRRIDFEKLQSYNNELVAWIYIPDTKIDYPIARHEDEDQTYYLNYDMYREPSYSGCIFMESMNKPDFTDNNTVIYGHNMKNGTMFKGLHKFEDQKFFDKNRYVYIYLPDRTLVYEIFAAYTTDDTHILSAYDFRDKKVYEEYLNNVTDPHYMGANIRKDTVVTTDNTIITLSTCVGGQPENRYLVQGVLKYDKTVK